MLRCTEEAESVLLIKFSPELDDQSYLLFLALLQKSSHFSSPQSQDSSAIRRLSYGMKFKEALILWVFYGQVGHPKVSAP